MRIDGFRNWFDVEIALRDAAVEPHVRPTRRAIANLCLGAGLEDAYYSVRELREAIALIHGGERRGRRKLADILSNRCDDFQRALYYALAGRGVVLVIDDLLWLEELLRQRSEAAAALLAKGGRMMPLVNPYVAEAPDGPVLAFSPDFELGPSWYLDPDLAI
jgi:hypothetical protein